MRCLRALIPLLLLLLSLVACHPDDPVATRRFEQATRLLPIEPEESLLLLDSIEYPENLNARQNARWCMLKGQVADTIHSPMPYSSQLERAVRYFKREGSAMEQAQALFYLGRAYADEKIYNGAQEMYPALASLYIELGNLDSARYYCRLAEAPTTNDHTHIQLYYKYYLIAKQEKNTNQALSYLEQYFERSDSITFARNNADIISVEKRYKHNHLISENRILRKSNYRYISLSIFILLIASVFVIIYQIRVNRRNRIIIAQQQAMQEKNERLQLLEHELANTNAELNQISTQLEQYKNSRSSEENQALLSQYTERKHEAERLMSQIQKQRQDLFQESAIMKRLLKLSEKVVAGSQTSLLSAKDWKAIYAQVASSYPTAARFLRESDLTEKEQQLAYLSVFNFEAKREAILLGAQLDAVNKSRQRLRRKLGITDRNLSLHDYLVSME